MFEFLSLSGLAEFVKLTSLLLLLILVFVGILWGFLFLMALAAALIFRELIPFCENALDEWRDSRFARIKRKMEFFDGTNPKWPVFRYWGDNDHNQRVETVISSGDNSLDRSQQVELSNSDSETSSNLSMESFEKVLKPTSRKNSNKTLAAKSSPISTKVIWYSRDIQDYKNLHPYMIRYESNPKFDRNNPKGFQISRVYINENGRVLEHTRQVMCLYCQSPTFHYWKGEDCLKKHVARAHGDQLGWK